MFNLFSNKASNGLFEDAISKVIPVSKKEKFSDKYLHPSSISKAARHLHIDRYFLLKLVADQLGFKSVSNVPLPEDRYIEMSGFTVSELKQYNLLPVFSSKFKYRLLISNPDILSIPDFINSDIEIVLALEEDIKSSWAEYDRAIGEQGKNQQNPIQYSFCTSQYIKVADAILDLVKVASSYKSREIYISTGSNNKYQFFSEEKCYEGRLSDAIAHCLMTDLPLLSRFINQRKECSSLNEIQKIHLTPFFCSQSFYFIIKWQECRTSIPIGMDVKLSSSSVNQQTGKVIIIDDDIRFAGILKRLLGSEGINARIFTNASAALEELKRQEVSLAICDFHMPEHNGNFLIDKLKEQGIKTRIIMLTSDKDFTLRKESIDKGIDAFVCKDDDPRILVAWCKNILSKQIKYECNSCI